MAEEILLCEGPSGLSPEGALGEAVCGERLGAQGSERAHPDHRAASRVEGIERHDPAVGRDSRRAHRRDRAGQGGRVDVGEQISSFARERGLQICQRAIEIEAQSQQWVLGSSCLVPGPSWVLGPQSRRALAILTRRVTFDKSGFFGYFCPTHDAGDTDSAGGAIMNGVVWVTD